MLVVCPRSGRDRVGEQGLVVKKKKTVIVGIYHVRQSGNPNAYEPVSRRRMDTGAPCQPP